MEKIRALDLGLGGGHLRKEKKSTQLSVGLPVIKQRHARMCMQVSSKVMHAVVLNSVRNSKLNPFSQSVSSICPAPVMNLRRSEKE